MRQARRLGLQLGHLRGERRRRPVGGEALDVDPLLGDAAVEQRRLRPRPSSARGRR